MRKVDENGKKKRADIVAFMHSYYKENGLPPTFVEIRDRMGLASVSTVAYYMKCLADDGKVRRVRRGSKSYYLPL